MTTIKHVTYRNLSWDSAADLYLPTGFDEARKYSAIVSTQPRQPSRSSSPNVGRTTTCTTNLSR